MAPTQRTCRNIKREISINLIGDNDLLCEKRQLEKKNCLIGSFSQNESKIVNGFLMKLQHDLQL